MSSEKKHDHLDVPFLRIDNYGMRFIQALAHDHLRHVGFLHGNPQYDVIGRVSPVDHVRHPVDSDT